MATKTSQLPNLCGEFHVDTAEVLSWRLRQKRLDRKLP
jgi:hypothetical protein